MVVLFVFQVFIDDMEVFNNFCILYERHLTSPRLSIVSFDDPDDVFNIQVIKAVILCTGSCHVMRLELIWISTVKKSLI